MDILALLRKPETLKDIPISEIDKVADEISVLLETKINKSCIKIATSTTFGDIELPKAAFKCAAKDTVRDAVRTYCAHEKWDENVPVIPYISTALNRLAKNMIDDIKGTNKKVVGFVCPACKEFGIRETLVKEGDMFVCKSCIAQIESIERELAELKGQEDGLQRENKEITV